MKYIEARAKTIRKQKNEEPGLGEKLATDIRGALFRANDKTLIDDETDEVDEDAVTEPTQDILLTVATDGRKASLDPRLIHPKLEDNQHSKVNKAVRNMLALYRKHADEKALQLVFCDFSSPTGNGIFNVYDDLKKKLIENGVDESEIAFIHDAKTDSDKENMFAKARSGDIRFLLGSTQKMGVGTNVQERLVAIHEMDPPWKPSDIEQRLGRMDRQGNSFDNVYCYRYVTVDSFDLFMWSTLNRKLKMVNQALRRPEDCAREISEDAEPSYEDIMAITTGNESIKDFMETRQTMNKLKRMQDSHLDAQSNLGDKVLKARRSVERIEAFLENKEEEKALVQANQPMALHIDHPVPKLSDGPMMVTGGLKNLRKAIETMAHQAPRYRTSDIGTFGGLTVKISRMGSGPSLIINRLDGRDETLVNISDTAGYQSDLGGDFEKEDEYYKAAATLVRYVRKIGKDNGIEKTKTTLSNERENLANLEADIGAPFPYEDELKNTRKRHEELAKEVGDAIDEDKPIEASPILEFGKAVNRFTGEHDEMVRRLEIKVAENSPTVLVHSDELDDDLDLNLTDPQNETLSSDASTPHLS